MDVYMEKLWINNHMLHTAHSINTTADVCIWHAYIFDKHLKKTLKTWKMLKRFLYTDNPPIVSTKTNSEGFPQPN